MASVARWGAGLWLLAAILTTSGGGSAPAAEFKSGGWTGRDVNGGDGAFKGCQIDSKHPGDRILGFGIFVPGVFQVRISDRAWGLEPGALPVTLWVDSGEKLSGNAVAAAKNTVVVPINKGGKAFAEALKKGNVLHVTVPDGALDFKLSGTFKAIGELERCWNAGVGTLPKSATGGAPQGAAPQGSAPQIKRVKGADLLGLPLPEFAAQVVTLQDNGFFKLERASKQQLEQLSAALVWTMKGGFGFVTSVNANPDLQLLKETLVKQKTPRCKGELTSSADIRSLPGTAVQVKRVQLRCTDVGNGDAVTEVFSFYPHLSGQLVGVSHIAKDRTVAAAADGEFAKRVTTILEAK